MSVYIYSGLRTPIGKFLGSLYESDPTLVCVQVLDALFLKSKINKKLVQQAIFGLSIPSGMGQGISRKITLEAGLPIQVPSYIVNMVCGSGMQAFINACNEIKLGSHCVLTGGFEFMSNIPYATDTYLRLGKKFGDFKMVDLMIKDGLLDSRLNYHMGITAENIANALEISREMQDEYACLAQKRAIAAVESNVFSDEIVPIKLIDYKGIENVFTKDEFPNPKSTIENLSKLKPSFLKDGNGTVTAGNSSGINDGAAFLLVGDETIGKKIERSPLIEVVDYVSVGCSPETMGLGPFYAIEELLNRTKLNIKDIDVFEINEAFSSQILGCFKMMEEKYKLNQEYFIQKTNLNGSGLGLGHPLGCTGARIIVTLFHSMVKNKFKYGIASLCVGGGQGLAVLLRRCNDERIEK